MPYSVSGSVADSMSYSECDYFSDSVFVLAPNSVLNSVFILESDAGYHSVVRSVADSMSYSVSDSVVDPTGRIRCGG